MSHFSVFLVVVYALCASSWKSQSLTARYQNRRVSNCIRLFGSHLDDILSTSVPLGSVSLVGAGPGDPDLLTVQAVRLLSQASLVISDRLVSKEILAMIKCELRIAKKRPGCAEEAQEEIYTWTKDAVLAGKHVVRLKIGDPFLFGRGGEEVLEFRKLGVEPLLVPGVSSAYAAPLSAKIPLTHRGISNSVLISTGYGKNEAVIEIPEYSSDRTVVLLMAVGRIDEIAKNMTMIGYPKQTPVAIIEKATTPLQRTLTGTLETIGEVARREGATAPATIVIGEVVNVLRENENEKDIHSSTTTTSTTTSITDTDVTYNLMDKITENKQEKEYSVSELRSSDREKTTANK